MGDQAVQVVLETALERGYLTADQVERLSGDLSDGLFAALESEVDAGQLLELREVHRKLFNAAATLPPQTGAVSKTWASRSEGGAADESTLPPRSLGGTSETAADLDGGGFWLKGVLKAGSRLGQYTILSELGRGGMGVVYEAQHDALERRVALKVLTTLGTRDVARFLIEGQATASIRHPNVVGIHEVGQVDRNLYMAMNLIDGEPLSDKLRREGTLEVEEAVRIGRILADVLVHIHQRGVLHRDLKPSNVMINSEGQPLLTDFGLAKLVDEGGGLTRSRDIVGTPAYMSPEQARGSGSKADHRADIYSLGATLYALLTGKPPFRADNMITLMVRIMERAPKPPSELRGEISPKLDAVCLKCLAKDPNERYATAAELVADLDLLVGDALLTRTRSRAPWILGTGLVLAVGVVVGIRASSQPDQRQEATVDEGPSEPDPAVVRAQEAQRAHARLAKVKGDRARYQAARAWIETWADQPQADTVRREYLNLSVRLAHGEPRVRMRYKNLIRKAQFFPDGTVFLCSERGALFRWDPDAPNPGPGVTLRSPTWTGHFRAQACQRRADGWAVAGTSDREVKGSNLFLVQLKTGRVVKRRLSPSTALAAAQFGINVLASSQDDRWLAIGYESGDVHVLPWSQVDTADPQELRVQLRREATRVPCLAFTEDGLLAVLRGNTTGTGLSMNTLTLYHLVEERWTQLEEVKLRTEGNRILARPGTRELVIAMGWSYRLEVFDTIQRALLDREFVAPGAKPSPAARKLMRIERASHSSGIKALAVSPDGRRVFSGSVGSGLRVWDLGSGKLLGSRTGAHQYWALDVDPSGKRLLVAYDLPKTEGGWVEVWDLDP